MKTKFDPKIGLPYFEFDDEDRRLSELYPHYCISCDEHYGMLDIYCAKCGRVLISDMTAANEVTT